MCEKSQYFYVKAFRKGTYKTSLKMEVQHLNTTYVLFS